MPCLVSSKGTLGPISKQVVIRLIRGTGTIPTVGIPLPPAGLGLALLLSFFSSENLPGWVSLSDVDQSIACRNGTFLTRTRELYQLMPKERTNTSHWHLSAHLLYTGPSDPNNARAGVARYFLVVGPVPPPMPRDLVLARLHGVLDGGVFEHPWNVNLHLQATPLENPGSVQGATPPIGGHGGTQRAQAATELED